jgi:16S rRNA (cytosine1402-N4)-methyltransferase
MRMGPGAGASAEEAVNGWSEAELGRALREYGEEKAWRVVARRIVAARGAAPLRTTAQLVAAIGDTVIRGGRRGGGRGGGRGIHPATRTFQALRIAVNQETLRLEAALPAAIAALAPGGRLAAISFHSLEDRLVKHAFLAAAGRPTPDREAESYSMEALEALAAGAVGAPLTRRPQLPSAAEAAANPRSRSAKLRVFEKRR